MNYTNLNVADTFSGVYQSFHISHDGEGDDVQALAIAYEAIKGKSVTVDCVIGNPDIVHGSATNKSEEMAARIRLTNEVFHEQIAVPGARSNNEVSSAYVTGILEQSLDKKCLVLHTDSFASLKDLFNRAKPGQLKNVVILTYGSVNLTWAMLKLEPTALPNPEDYKSFYDSLAASGAKLVQVEGFPFLDTKGKLTLTTTPLTYKLLSHFDGPVGQKWTQINTSAADKIRPKNAERIAEFILQGMAKATNAQKAQLNSLVSDIAKLLGSTLDETALSDALADPKKLKQMLDKSVDGVRHGKLEGKLTELSTSLLSLLEVKKDDLMRPVNIYTGVTLQGQALIADQIPAILFSELLENRTNGLLRDCLPVQFEGLDGRYACFAVSSTKGSLYYLDTAKKLGASATSEQKTKAIASYLKYIDLCMAIALLANNQIVTSATRIDLLTSDYKTELVRLAEQVRKLGYDLPNGCYDLCISNKE